MTAPSARIVPLAYADEVLATLDFPERPLIVTRGLGSGLAYRRGDPPGTIWAVGDRGPNLKVPFAISRYGIRHLRRFADVEGAKVMPCLGIGPAMSELRVEADRVVCVRTIPLRNRDGSPVSGVPIPGGFSEPAIDGHGHRIAPDPGGADSEGIAAASDGTFWIADEYGPSLLHVAADGMVLARWVPEGCGHWFRDAGYPIVEALPAIATQRQLNRGFEALTLSADEASLYLAFQSPLAHPDEKAYRHGRHVRVWQLDLASRSVIAQYLYPLDDSDTFLRDCALGKMHRSDVKVSEMLALDDERLAVLERGSATTKLYVVGPDPANLIDPAHLDIATAPTLEQRSGGHDLGKHIRPLAKTLLLSSDDHPELGADLEGLAAIGPTSLLIVNDNDFGVAGVATRFWRIELDAWPSGG
ncbi:esterase-like activity of phytase family protein [Sphingomonas sp.]|uniref:esterase-like activity of phytase family protein n=1 Tax=Sphingomonas sp. TaxID=28214 RepID=UPI0035BBB0C6